MRFFLIVELYVLRRDPQEKRRWEKSEDEVWDEQVVVSNDLCVPTHGAIKPLV